jgi:Predicted membrane protein
MYPPSTFAVESVMLVLYCALSYLRTSLGSSGNKSESLQLLVIMMALSLPQVVFQVYMMAFQVYVCASSPPGAASMSRAILTAGWRLIRWCMQASN